MKCEGEKVTVPPCCQGATVENSNQDIEDTLQILNVIRLIAPDLQEVGDEELIQLINLHKKYIWKKRFLKFYYDAVANYVAHKYLIQKLTTEYGGENPMVMGGGITSEHEGGLSHSYAIKAVQGMLDPLDKTIYGIEYKRIRQQCIVPVHTRFY